MGLSSRIPRPFASGSWGPEDDRWYSPGGSFYGGVIPTDSGVSVDSDSAMRLITVQNCVRMRATTIARLRCHVMEQSGKDKQKATDFYLYEKLHDQPNSWMTAPEFWGMAEAHLSLRGNFYAFKSGLNGRPIQDLIPIKPDRIIKIEQKEDFSLEYHVRMKDGKTVPFPGRKIFHIKGMTLDGITGANPIEYARESVGLGMASGKFLARYFGKGLHPGAVIKHPLSLSAPAHKNLKQNLQEKYEGLSKSHEFMLLDEAMEITFPEIKLVDAQYLEQMKLTDAQICGLFRVPLMLVNGGDKEPTYASAEQFMLFYQMFSIDAPFYEAAIRRDLLTVEERKRYYAKFGMEGLLRGSMKDRAEFYQLMVNAEIYNPNECRELEDRNPYDGGDDYRTRTSTTKDSGKTDQETTK